VPHIDAPTDVRAGDSKRVKKARRSHILERVGRCYGPLRHHIRALLNVGRVSFAEVMRQADITIIVPNHPITAPFEVVAFATINCGYHQGWNRHMIRVGNERNAVRKYDSTTQE